MPDKVREHTMRHDEDPAGPEGSAGPISRRVAVGLAAAVPLGITALALPRAAAATSPQQPTGTAVGTLDAGFVADTDGSVEVVVRSGAQILIGGSFTTIGGVSRNRLARLHANGAVDMDFDPNVEGSRVYDLAVQSDGAIVLGGDFDTVDGVPRRALARVHADGSLDDTFDANVADFGRVEALALGAGGAVVIGGNFASVGGASRSNLARVGSTGALDTDFSPSASGTVYAVAVRPDGDILVGGAFSRIGTTDRSRIARLDADGTVDANFAPDLQGSTFVIVYDLAVQSNGDILLGGTFNSIDDVTRNRVARLRADGTLDGSFAPDLDREVRALLVQGDGAIVMGGQFTSVGGVPRGRIARVSAAGVLDVGFAPDVDSTVSALAVQSDGRLVVGGGFSFVDDEPRGGLARIS